MAEPPGAGRDDEAERLRAGAELLGCPLEPAQVQALLAYRALIERWNRRINLTAVRDPDQMLVQHLLDSLAVVAPLRRHAAGRDLTLLDVGSGAGLPGVVLAIACPSWRITCLDAVAKKAGFVRQVAAELRLPQLRAVHARVEAAGEPAGFDLIVSRAFASLDDFVRLTRGRLAAGGAWAAMKGRRPDDEIERLPAEVEMFHVEPLQVPGLGAERCLVWLRPRAPTAP